MLAPHETIELHELLTFKDLCLTKSAAMSSLASDDELKQMLQNDALLSQQHVMELCGHLQGGKKV
ncbi:MAG: hypothetical protein Q8878_10510 [Bacillota bacterium]|nr:hypothetical protein [Bacillota bacterium]